MSSIYTDNLKVLGLKPSPSLTLQQVKSAYRKLVMKHHPDKFKSEANKQKATKNFKKITNAYNFILDNLEACKNCGEEPRQEYSQEYSQEQPKKTQYKEQAKKARKQEQSKQGHKQPTQYKQPKDFDELFNQFFSGVSVWSIY